MEIIWFPASFSWVLKVQDILGRWILSPMMTTIVSEMVNGPFKCEGVFLKGGFEIDKFYLNLYILLLLFLNLKELLT